MYMISYNMYFICPKIFFFLEIVAFTKNVIFLNQGGDSPTIKLCYLIFVIVSFQWKTLLEENFSIEEIGESQPWIPGTPGVPQGFRECLWCKGFI